MQSNTTSAPGTTVDPREMAQRAQAGIDRLRSTAHDTVERAAGVAASAADRLSVRGEEWLSAKDEWLDATRGYVREHPFAALGIALAAGYLLSRMSGR